MSLYLKTDADQFPLASNAGWGLLGAWLDTVDADAAPDLVGLWEHGWADDASAVAAQLEAALGTPPDGDAAKTAKELLATLGPLGDAAVVVSDGFEADAESESAPPSVTAYLREHGFTGTDDDALPLADEVAESKDAAGHEHSAKDGRFTSGGGGERPQGAAIAAVLDYARKLKDGRHAPQTVATIKDVLGPLSKDEVASVCRELGFEALATGNSKAAMIDKLHNNLTVLQHARGNSDVILGKRTPDDPPPELAGPPRDPEKMLAHLEKLAAAVGADPHSVDDEQMTALRGHLEDHFTGAQLKDLALRLTGKAGKGARDSLDRIEVKLVGDRRMLDRQNV